MSVALQGGKLVVGAPHATANGVGEAGAVYVFKRQAYGEWLQIAKLVADDPMPYAHFGSKVALDVDRIVAGAPGYTSWLGKGAAYLFEYDHHDAFWRPVKRLLPHDKVEDSVFARSVAIAGNFVAVGRFGDDSVYLYKTDGDSWWKQVILRPSLRSDPGSGAGWEVAMEGKTLAISAPEDLPPSADEDHYTGGVVHVFENSGGEWVPTAALSKPLILDYFGAGLGMGEGYIAATSAREGSSNAVFRKNSFGEWVEVLSFAKRDINEILPIAVSSKYLAHPIWPRGDFHPCIVVYKLPDLIANPGIYSLVECAKPIDFESTTLPSSNGDSGTDESGDNGEEQAVAVQPSTPANDAVLPPRRSGGGSLNVPLLGLFLLISAVSRRRLQGR